MRLLVINPNTTESVTELVADLGRRLAEPGSEIRAVTGRFGARYISSRSAATIAGHAALELLATHVEGCDAVYLACFGDPGLGALRELAPVPVIGMAEAGCRAAAAGGRRFAVVTGGERWIPMLTEYVATLGLSAQLGGVHAVAPTGAEIAADPEGSIALLAEGCRIASKKFRADVVVLGGAGLAPIAPRVAAMLDFPVIDGLAAAITAAAAVAVKGLSPGTTLVTTAARGMHRMLNRSTSSRAWMPVLAFRSPMSASASGGTPSAPGVPAPCAVSRSAAPAPKAYVWTFASAPLAALRRSSATVVASNGAAAKITVLPAIPASTTSRFSPPALYVATRTPVKAALGLAARIAT